MNNINGLGVGASFALALCMESVLDLNWNKLSVAGFIACTMASAWTSMPQSSTIHMAIELPRLQIVAQKQQARELLTRVPTSLTGNEEIERRLGLYIYHTLQASLPVSYRDQSQEIAVTLINEANRYKLDPLFLLAVIKTESGFNPLAVGRHGDSGLMQLLPKTGQWVGHQIGIRGQVNLLNPIVNIKIGAAYFAHLRRHFAGVGSRYLAAYNMGTRNVHRLLKEAKEPMIYATQVVNNYRAFYQALETMLPSRPASTIVSMN